MRRAIEQTHAEAGLEVLQRAGDRRLIDILIPFRFTVLCARAHNLEIFG
jgi:hypothetical protein